MEIKKTNKSKFLNVIEKKVKCPYCKKITKSLYSPFCSKKCSDLDLLKWLSNESSINLTEDN